MKTKDAYCKAKEIVEKYDKKKVSHFHVEDDLFCLKKFDNDYFDWVYLDTSHKYEHTANELEILKDKLKDEGIISGHDWQPDPKNRHHGVYMAVNAFCTKYGWKIIELDNYSQWAIKKCK